MTELVFNVIESAKGKVFNMLRTTKIILSAENKCRCLTLSSATDLVELASNQEQADSRVILHALNALELDKVESVIIRPPSGDVDICVLVTHHKEKIFLDNGKSDARRLIPPSSIDLSNEHRTANLGFYAFTSNDYVSSFFGKGKKTCWSKFLHRPTFAECFLKLGAEMVLKEEIFAVLEEFVFIMP